MELTQTPDKILDAAEKLFAEHGITGVSIRSIVKEAGANVASVNYHFGSKDQLVRAVLSRRLIEVNQRRLSELKQLREKHRSSPIPIKELLTAFLEPAIKLGQSRGRHFFKIIARAHAETDEVIKDELFSQLEEVIREFTTELKRTREELVLSETAMRLAFSAGVMVHIALHSLRDEFTKRFAEQEITDDDILELVVAFCAGGFCAEGVLK